jgi:signal transduction histidine kinase
MSNVAQSTIIAHGGRIELTSTPGHGAICTVRLPAEPKP